MIPTTLDEKLRDQPTDESLLEEALAEEQRKVSSLRLTAKDDPSELNTTRLGRQRQRQSEYLRLAGRLDEAREAIEEAISIWEKYGRHRAFFLARLKRAVLTANTDALQDLLDEMDEETAVYEDFLHEAMGRVHMLRGEVEEAHLHLLKALEIRRVRGNDRHIAQTKEMLAIVENARSPTSDF